MAISFRITKPDEKLRDRALARVKERVPSLDILSAAMDLTACHANGCALDFAKLAEADDFTLHHDVHGIMNHLDRQTGKLTGHFDPRCSR